MNAGCFVIGVDAHTVPALLAIAVATVVALAGSPRQMRSKRLLLALLVSASLSALAIAQHCGGAAYGLIPAALLPLRVALGRRQEDARPRAALSAALFGTSVPIALGLALQHAGGSFLPFGEGCLIIGLLCRFGVAPFHAWLPELAESGPLSATVLSAALPIGAVVLGEALYTVAPEMRLALITLGCGSALYGAVLALAQVDLRRMVGFLLVSQAGAMLVAAASASHESLAGIALAPLAYALPAGGLLALATAIEARTGTARMDRVHGLGTPAPHMAAAFLVLGFALVGFPGSLGFVAEDLMLQGVLGLHPIVGALLLLATAVNAVTIFRCFQRVFLGPLPHQIGLAAMPDLITRERLLLVLLVVLVVTTGCLPSPLLRNVALADPTSSPSSQEAHP